MKYLHVDTFSNHDLIQLARVENDKLREALVHYAPHLISIEVVEKLKLGRDIKIWKLLMLGRSNTECGGIFGLSEGAVRNDIRSKLQTQISTIQNSYYKDKKQKKQSSKSRSSII